MCQISKIQSLTPQLSLILSLRYFLRYLCNKYILILPLLFYLWISNKYPENNMKLYYSRYYIGNHQVFLLSPVYQLLYYFQPRSYLRVFYLQTRVRIPELLLFFLKVLYISQCCSKILNVYHNWILYLNLSSTNFIDI